MSWIQYEVWVETEDGGPDDLVHTTASLKEAKDMFDRLRSPFGHTEYITVKPEDYNTAFRELRKVGIRV